MVRTSRRTSRRTGSAAAAGWARGLLAAGLTCAVLVAAPGQGRAAAPPAGPTLFGAVVAKRTGETTFAQAQARADAAYGGLQISRVFYGGAPQPWPGAAGLSGRPVVVSFQYPPAQVVAGTWDAALTTWFATAPKDRAVYWSYIHEPENDIEQGQFTALQYRNAYRHVAALAAAHAPANLHSTLILMCWTLGPVSGRNWRDYYPDDASVDAVAFDCYNYAGRQGQYVDPATLFSRVLTWAATSGKPWGIAEVGSIRTKADTTGARRAAWLTDVAAYLRAQHPLFVNYFDVKLATDYRLLDAPSIAAWRAAVNPPAALTPFLPRAL